MKVITIIKKIRKINKKLAVVVGALVLLLLVGGTAVGLNGYFGGGGSIPGDTFTNGLVGYWNFDEGNGQTTNDASDSNNDGTLGATSAAGTDDPAWVTGKHGSALDFDGDDHVSAPDADHLDFSGTDPFTINLWVKLTSYPGNSTFQGLFDKEKTDGSGRQGYTAFLDGNGSGGLEMGFQRYLNGTAQGTSNTDVGTDASLNAWHMYTFTYDGSTMKLFLDGVQKNSISSTQSLIVTTWKVSMGARREATGGWLTGAIDEVRVYNRALSAAEVQFHYSRGAPVAHYKMDEGAGRYAYDSTEISQDIVNNLAAYWSMNDNVSGNAQTITDISGTGNNGTTDDGANNTGMNCTVAGKSGTGCDLDGADDFITVADATNLRGGQNLTISLWFNIDSTASFQKLITKSTSSTSKDWELGVNQAATGDVGFESELANNLFGLTSAGSLVTAGTWYHLIAVLDMTGSCVRLYLDSAQVAQDCSTFAGNSDSTTAILDIGRRRYTATLYFGGVVDEVYIFNRVLTPAEITYLYNLQNNDGVLGDARCQAGSGACPTWTTGQYGTALDFDGSDDFAFSTDKSELDFIDTDDITISGWFNRDTATTDDVILAKRNSLSTNTDAGYIAYLDATNDNLIFEVSDGTDEYSLTSSASFTSTGWNHFAIVWDQDSANNSEIYINGKKDSATDAGTIGNIGSLANAVQFRIASESDGASYFDGKLDDIRIYKYARTEDEIRLDYNGGFAARFGGSPNQDVTRGLLGYWDLEEGVGQVVDDSSGTGNEGTLGTTSAASSDDPSWAIGKPGNGSTLDFDGSADLVNIPDNDTLDFGDTSDLSIVGWFNRDTATSDDVILAKRNSLSTNTDAGYIVYLDATNDNLIFEVSDGTDEYSLTSASTFTATGWNHFVVVWDQDSANNSEIYINGVANGATDAGTIGNIGSIANAVALRMGSESDGASYFDGKLDELRLYNRTLSAAEIQYLYNQGGPLIHWKLDEGSASTAFDATGNGNNGSITGATYATGQYGTGLDFDGSGDMVSMSHFDSASESSAGAGSGDITWSHTVSTGSDRILLVGVYIRGLDNSPTVSGITYNGDAFTKVDDIQTAAIRTELWYLLNPDLGTNSIVVSFSAASISTRITGAVSLKGFAQAAHEAENEGTATATSISVDVTTITDGAWVIDAVGHRNETDQDITPGANQTERMELAPDTGNILAMSTEVQPTAGATTMSWSGDVSHDFSLVGAAFAPTNSFPIASNYFTVSTWVNPETTIASKALAVKDEEIRLVTDASGNPLCQIHNGVSWQTAATSSVALSLGRWQHVACTYDQANLKVYVNGIETASQSLASISILDSESALELGNDASATYNDYEGRMDDFRYYKYARNASEIRVDYNGGFAARFGGSPADWMTQGLVGYWNLEEGSGQTVSDGSDQNNDGTLGADSSASTDDPSWIAGKAGFGGALDFDGSSDFVDLDNPTSLQLTGAMTISAWVKLDSLANNDRFVAKQGASGNRSWSLGMEGANDALAFQISSVGSDIIGAELANSAETGVWMHVVGVYTPSISLTLYKNGVQINQNTTSIPASQFNSSVNANIGRRPDGCANCYTNGQIDEVRIYNRALTAEEVRYLYNQGDPVAYWKFDEGSGSTAFDSTNITNDGTITGATYTTGQYGTALDFDGSDDEISVTNANSIDFDVGLNDALTFSAWVNADTDGEGDVGRIIDKGTNTFIRVGGESGGKLDLVASIDLATTDATLTVSAVLNTNQWHHVLMVYEDDSDDEISLYVDGKLVGTSTNGDGAPAGTDTNNLIIGGDSSTTGNFDGTIDDVRIYNYARSASEIRVDYNAGLSTHFR